MDNNKIDYLKVKDVVEENGIIYLIDKDDVRHIIEQNFLKCIVPKIKFSLVKKVYRIMYPKPAEEIYFADIIEIREDGDDFIVVLKDKTIHNVSFNQLWRHCEELKPTPKMKMKEYYYKRSINYDNIIDIRIIKKMETVMYTIFYKNDYQESYNRDTFEKYILPNITNSVIPKT
jgi:hypothetical protein